MSTPEPTGADGHRPDTTETDDEVRRLQDELDVANDCGPADEVEPPGTPPE